jgi:hypothetical protein
LWWFIVFLFVLFSSSLNKSNQIRKLRIDCTPLKLCFEGKIWHLRYFYSVITVIYCLFVHLVFFFFAYIKSDSWIEDWLYTFNVMLWSKNLTPEIFLFSYCGDLLSFCSFRFLLLCINQIKFVNWGLTVSTLPTLCFEGKIWHLRYFYSVLSSWFIVFLFNSFSSSLHKSNQIRKLRIDCTLLTRVQKLTPEIFLFSHRDLLSFCSFSFLQIRFKPLNAKTIFKIFMMLAYFLGKNVIVIATVVMALCNFPGKF